MTFIHKIICSTVLHIIIFQHISASDKEWATIFAHYQSLLEIPKCHIIYKQYNAYITDKLPAISHPNILIIPIIECNEKLVDLKQMNHSRIQMLPDPTQPFAGPTYNSGFLNSPKIRLSLLQKLEHMIIFLDELAPQFGYKNGQVSIKVFEGLRDLKTQKLLYDNKKQEIQQLYPDYTETELDAETSKWVSPVNNNIPVHSTGAAIDLRLFNNETQEFIDMGIFGVIWQHNDNAPTYSSNITKRQKINRLYLQINSALAGLTNYPFEFWHFSYGDRYAAYWQENDTNKRIASYNFVN